LTEKLTATINLIRPINFLITFISVIVAAIICQPDNLPVLNVYLAALAASFVLASGNIINDIHDVEIDKINRPYRPIPSGKITQTNAYGLYTVLVFISILISVFLNETAIVIVLFSILLLFIYSKYLKKFPLIGNITVAYLTGLVFIYGGVIVANPLAAIVPAVFAFLINLIREIVKDIEDAEGDEKVGIVTFPIKFGVKKTKVLILFITLSLITYTFYPFLSQLYKIEYFVFVMVLVNPILVYCLKKLFQNHSVINLNRISNLIKLSMIFGLIAIYLGV